RDCPSGSRPVPDHARRPAGLDAVADFGERPRAAKAGAAARARAGAAAAKPAQPKSWKKIAATNTVHDHERGHEGHGGH
ncbi:hypothetical protein ACWDNT_06480, partial [Streptomyces sp. NPDC000963]